MLDLKHPAAAEAARLCGVRSRIGVIRSEQPYCGAGNVVRGGRPPRPARIIIRVNFEIIHIVLLHKAIVQVVSARIIDSIEQEM